MATLSRRFAVRWPAKFGGSSFEFRLTFWLLFCQEKSNNQKSKNPNFYIKINLTFATLLVSMSILLKMKATKRQSIPHQKTGNQLLQ